MTYNQTVLLLYLGGGAEVVTLILGVLYIILRWGGSR